MIDRYQNKVFSHIHMVGSNEAIAQLPVGLSLTSVIKMLLYNTKNDSFLIFIARLIFLRFPNPHGLTSTVIYSSLEQLK